MTDHLQAAWAEDIRVRTEGLERGVAGGHRVAVEEITGPATVYDSGGVTIRAIPVPHGDWTYAFAYRIDAPGKSVFISGDTRPSQALERAAAGVDILIHEAYPEVRLQPEPRPGGEAWPRYMRSFHTSDRELGGIAARVRPGLLVLYHVVRMGGTDDELLAGVRGGGFAGRIVIGHDLNRF
jgi:ribonuclease BN (tRNA processing enzyme)